MSEPAELSNEPTHRPSAARVVLLSTLILVAASGNVAATEDGEIGPADVVNSPLACLDSVCVGAGAAACPVMPSVPDDEMCASGGKTCHWWQKWSAEASWTESDADDRIRIIIKCGSYTIGTGGWCKPALGDDHSAGACSAGPFNVDGDAAGEGPIHCDFESEGNPTIQPCILEEPPEVDTMAEAIVNNGTGVP